MHAENLTPRFTDWEAIVAFYAAIHAAMAFLHRRADYDDTKDLPVRKNGQYRLLKHLHRRQMVHERILHIYNEYVFLENLAWEARYEKIDLSRLKASEVAQIRSSLRTVLSILTIK